MIRQRPLVSVITPVLNRIATIDACLESVQRQTYRPIEHIVVDGGSTDGTTNVLSSHKTDYGFRWISETDRGMYDAINKGLSLAQGEIFAYLNSDDLYLPWTVDVAVRSLGGDRELIYGDLGVVHYEANDRSGSFYIQFYPGFRLRKFAFVRTIGQPTAFWRRSLTERIGLFDTRYRLLGDCEYWLRAALEGARPTHIPELMAVQLEHASTLRATRPQDVAAEFARLRREMTAVIKPPLSMRWERVKASAGWRLRQIEFFLAMNSSRPKKWPHFVRELKERNIRMSFSDLRLLAPKRWRGGASLFGDPAIVQILMRGTSHEVETPPRDALPMSGDAFSSEEAGAHRDKH